MSDGGKGSKQRPTDLKQYSENYDAIFKKPEPTPQQLKQYAKAQKESLLKAGKDLTVSEWLAQRKTK